MFDNLPNSEVNFLNENIFLEYIFSYAIENNYLNIIGTIYNNFDNYSDFINFDLVNDIINLKNISPSKLIKYLKPKYSYHDYKIFL